MALFDLPLPELERYLPELDEPADLDDFWSRTLTQARRHDVLLDARRRTPVCGRARRRT
ncbi:acetylxylan esterase [Cellulomonas sp. PSBB021]|uniref:acetylxylan esterase n=1 Tax=Cellulomonas sp. PSBB021 TaxID=2003551 RepID=UPI0021007231|nr:acetylxylan esterase [Cellulomonas sp. PSBB021]